MTFEGDEDRVRQILVNLLNNAIKFTPAGGSVHVECGVADRAPSEAKLIGSGPWTFFQVTDTGRGIPEAIRERVFEPFFTTKAVGAGAGLGLAVSYSIVQKHGGKLELDAVPSGGTKATIKLPLASVRSRPS